MTSSRVVHAVASEPHFVDHLAPVWRLLPDEVRGMFATPHLTAHARSRGIAPVDDLPPGDAVLVASYGDVKRARERGYRRIAFLEHGIGQSYAGSSDYNRDVLAGRNGSYAGGEDRGDVSLFLVPNEHSANRWRSRYPDAWVEVTGSPLADTRPHREPGPGPTIAVSFHWDCRISAETRTAYFDFREMVARLAVKARPRWLGHGHPRLFGSGPAGLAEFYKVSGLEVVRNFDDVCRRADLYICDNSSTMYEFAATGRPVVVINARPYRRNIEHGLRFWEAADVGVNVADPRKLRPAIARALEDPPEVAAARERAVNLVYAHRGDAAFRASIAVAEWASGIIAPNVARAPDARTGDAGTGQGDAPSH